MRNPEDIVRVKIGLSAVATLDWERIEQDPLWDTICHEMGVQLEDAEQKREALFRYLGRYISSERLFDSSPVYSTNGPADLYVTDMEVLNASNSSSEHLSQTRPDHTTFSGRCCS